MNKDNLEELIRLSKNHGLKQEEVHRLYELNTQKLLMRDERRGKIVNYTYPEEQYKRSFVAVSNYIKRGLYKKYICD